jgi:nucleotide-binding universal stress UspA family protein
MKCHLVAVEPSEQLAATLQTAANAARFLEARLDGTFVSANPPTIMVASGDGLAAAAAHEMIEGYQVQERERAAVAGRTFVDTLAAAGLSVPDRSKRPGPPSARWLDDMTNGLEDLARLASLYDLTIIGRPTKGQPAPSMAALETVLFSGGRPLLIAPPGPTKDIGRSVVVAWKNSPETARTVALAMPLLTRAAEVHVLSIDTADGTAKSGDVLCDHLVLNGISARPVHRDAGGRLLGPAILDEAEALGADLLVKGAYTQSRISQLIFGGATRHILGHARVPVFMAH